MRAALPRALLGAAGRCWEGVAYRKKGVLTGLIPAAIDSGETTIAIGEVTSEVALTGRPAGADADEPDAPDADSDPPSGGEEDESEGDD